MDIVFLRTRWHYGSYTDYWRLVELAGFETIWLDELEPGRKAIYIVSPRNGELPDVLARLQGDHACKFVWWCLERPDAQGSVTRGAALEEGIDELWLSDRWLANLHRLNGWGPVRFVPVGSHKGLGTFAKDRARKVAHMSYVVPRRKAVYDSIKVPMAPNCWGGDRDRELRESWAMVNVHQDGWQVLEPLRFALAAAYGLMIYTETVKDPWPYRDGREGHDIRMELYDNLAGQVNCFAQQLLGDEEFVRRQIVHSCWHRMCREFEFGKCVREAVACLE